MALAAEPVAERLSIAAFAARLGVAKGVVRRGIRSGRLEKSLGLNAREETVIVDVALAEQEWEANKHPAKERGGPNRTIAEERRRLTRAQARKVELLNRRTSGSLVSRRSVEIRYATLVVTCKTKIRGVPSRIKQRIPHLTLTELAIIAELLDEALEELADGR